MISQTPAPVFFASPLEPLFEGISDGVLALDAQGRSTYLNTRAERLLGRNRRELLGHPLWTRLPALEETALGRACRRALAEGVPVTGEEYLAWLDAWVETRVFPSGGGLLVLLRDVTPLKQLETDAARLCERALRERAQAEDANRAKDALLATVSHELRTPLTAILGWTHILRTTPLPPDKQERALETLESSARAQVRLVDDLLDSARIIAGKMHLEQRAVELAPVVESVLEAARPSALLRGLHLECTLEPLGAPVHGDALRLHQVVSNLLANAIKFTPREGQVRLHLRRVEAHAWLEVSDTGQGIPPDFLPHVFERFQQAEGGATPREGGLGLGLAIVRHLVELHGGSVQAHSDGENRGARFIVRLPLGESASTVNAVGP